MTRLFSPLLERAMRVAAAAHEGQCRKATALPYISHPAAVALILSRVGFVEEHIQAAALLHDVLEDTSCTEADLAAEFPQQVVDIVRALSERKTEPDGTKRAWKDRKQEHLADIRHATPEAKAVVLADKLHNLGCMQLDFAQTGSAMWDRFNASQDEILWYHREMIAAADCADARIQQLQSACRKLIEDLQ